MHDRHRLRIAKAADLVQKVQAVEDLNSKAYDRIKKEVSDDTLIVTGFKDVSERTDGIAGTFTFCTLGEPLDLERFFDGKTAPEWEQVARYVAYTATGQTLTKAPKKAGKDWLAGEVGGYRIHLIYAPDVAFMRSNAAALGTELAERIAKAAEGKPILVYGAMKFMSQKDLSRLGITFCQLPYAIHRILGDGPDEA